MCDVNAAMCDSDADRRGGLGDLLPHLRGVRGGGGEPSDGGHGDVPGHLHRVGAGRDGDGVLRRPHLRRAPEPGRLRRVRHLRAVPLEAGARVRGGAGDGRHGGEPDAAAAVRERQGALLRDRPGGLRRAVARHRVHHLLQPHVRRLWRRHGQQSRKRRNHLLYNSNSYPYYYSRATSNFDHYRHDEILCSVDSSRVLLVQLQLSTINRQHPIFF